MMVLCGQSNKIWHYFSGAFPKKVGVLFGPSYLQKVCYWMPYALDNDAFTAWTKNQEWKEKPWVEMLEKAKLSGINPIWSLVPDKVADKMETLKKWDKYYPTVESFGFTKAFACQDGMTIDDVPQNADVIFIGGTTKWKLETIPYWTENHPRVHVGRVNTLDRLQFCEYHGVESIDGSGWFMDTFEGKRIVELTKWLKKELKPYKPYKKQIQEEFAL